MPHPGPGEVCVRVSYAGICGSDLHYFLHGGFGKIRMQEPMVLGHEGCGIIQAVGSGVDSDRIGQWVAVNPSLSCRVCDECRAGRVRFCTSMCFMGSATRNPPVEGVFRQHVVCTAAQALPYTGETLEEAALAEPLAVCLHAISQVNGLNDKRVLITGFGPIGALCLLVARHAGAAHISVTDVSASALDLARQLGANAAYDSSVPGALDALTEEGGCVDVSLECSAHPSAIADAITATRPCGTVVQIGMLGLETTAPLTHIVTKELNFRGSFRFDVEFEEAVKLIASRKIDVRPLITQRLSLAEADKAFSLAQDRNQSMKVLFKF
ncbi:L-idonate 5-dehydrogenase [Vreelandella neptunia]|uniref:L-idonate 5-dehydrogenase n=1 Tax=Vreelandella neptunia TaxID=115551 RepID=A0ABS9S393_9GAMM|nr:L-idonate 5-dehydrogenase [Halomonas neptunia]MCH4810563.1 L-idonate 5-dehydrogenase [Halomonas neptunia]